MLLLIKAEDWFTTSWAENLPIHGRPLFAKLSFNDFKLVKIAAIHPDFM
jgi:hypothetical protein